MNDHDVLVQFQRSWTDMLPLPDGWRAYDRLSKGQVIRDKVLALTPDGFVYGDPAHGRTFRAAAYADLRDCWCKPVLTLKGNPDSASNLAALVGQWVRTAMLVLVYTDGKRSTWRIPLDFDPSPFVLADQIVADFHSFVARRQATTLADELTGGSRYTRSWELKNDVANLRNRMASGYTWFLFLIAAAFFSCIGIQLVGNGASIVSYSVNSSANVGDTAGGIAGGVGLMSLASVLALAWPYQLLQGRAQQVYSVIVGLPLAFGFAGALIALSICLLYVGFVNPDTAVAQRVMCVLGSGVVSGLVLICIAQALRGLAHRRHRGN